MEEYSGPSSIEPRPVLALPIFPGRRQPSIVGRNELNYRVRNGNGWTLALISTNFVGAKSASFRFHLAVKTPFRSFAPPPQLELASLDFELVLKAQNFAPLCYPSKTWRTNCIINFFASLVKSFPASAYLPAHRSQGLWCTFTDSNRGPTD